MFVSGQEGCLGILLAESLKNHSSFDQDSCWGLKGIFNSIRLTHEVILARLSDSEEVLIFQFSLLTYSIEQKDKFPLNHYPIYGLKKFSIIY